MTKYCNGYTPPPDPAKKKIIPRYPAKTPPLFTKIPFSVYLLSGFNTGDFNMAKNIRGKRPCCICRKWFQPIAQQNGRQRACSKACRKELHRRQCEQWNRKNKAYFKSNYLADKLQAIDQQEQSIDAPADQQARANHSPLTFIPQSNRTQPILPMDIIVARLGKKNAVIIQYLVFQLTCHARAATSGFP